MESLSHPDYLYLSAAQGWFELGNSTEAAAELDRLAPGLQEHPQVLELRWQIAVKAKEWLQALAVAEALCCLAPEAAFGWIHRSYCLHELKRTQEAWDMLLPIAERFPEEWLICYNLACYACQLGHVEDGKSWFNRAIKIGDPLEVNRLASEDPDLKPLFHAPG
ncbi:MAG: tetratricopeptide repeat protein [Verrucomicrobiota bacterium]